MLKENKYTKWYYSIVDNRIINPHDKMTYTERYRNDNCKVVIG